MDTSSWRTRALLEPRGFLRFIEFILAIVAFGTTTDFVGTFRGSIKCDDSSSVMVGPFKISYPFKLFDSPPVDFVDCSNITQTVTLEGDGSPSAQWFVFVGVMAFLFSLASIVFYVGFEAVYRATHERMISIGDLVITCLFAFFWLTAASAWASSLNSILKPFATWDCVTKDTCYSGESPLVNACHDYTCTPGAVINWSHLNVSITFGFLNFFLWACNIWFVYKETPFHINPAKENNFNQEAQIPPSNI